MSEQPSLYERLGGYQAIYLFAEDVLARLMDDDEIGHIWDHMSQDRVLLEHQNFVDWLCEHFGGPMMYRGRDLVTVHKGMGITERHWEILFEKFDESVKRFEAPPEIRDEVVTFLQKFKPAIVGSPSFRETVRGPNGKSFTGGIEAHGVKWPDIPYRSTNPPKTKLG